MTARSREYFSGLSSGSSGSSSSSARDYSVGIELKGWEEFARAVQKIPSEYKRNVVLRVLRRSTPHTIRAIRNLLKKHDETGNLWESVGNITGKSREYPNVLVGYRVRGGKRGFHGLFLEEGTGARYRGRKRRNKTRRSKESKKIYTGRMPALRIIEKAAAMSEAQSVQLLEQEMLRETEKILKKTFR